MISDLKNYNCTHMQKRFSHFIISYTNFLYKLQYFLLFSLFLCLLNLLKYVQYCRKHSFYYQYYQYIINIYYQFDLSFDVHISVFYK